MSVFPRGDHYWSNFTIDGVRYQVPTGETTKRAAREIEEHLKTEIRRGNLGVVNRHRIPLFDVAIDDTLRWSEADHTPGTVERNRVRGVVLKKFFKDRRVHQIKREDVKSYVHWRKFGNPKRSIKNSTIIGELSFASTIYQRLMADGLALTNPFAGHKSIKPEERDYVVFSRTQQENYMAYADEVLRDFIGIIFETGLRPDELLSATKDQANLAASYFRVPKGKTKAARRNVPLTAEAKRILAKRMASKSPYLFPSSRSPKRPMLLWTLENLHAKARRRLLRFHKNCIDPRVRIYDARHTFASRATMAGVDVITLAKLLGHKDVRMAMKYGGHVSDEHEIAAVGKLEKYNSAAQIEAHEKTAENAGLRPDATTFSTTNTKRTLQ